MKYAITHTTHYTYSRPVYLGPHILRLCPRQDGSQWLRSFDLTISPEGKVQQAYFLDANGNTCVNATFQTPLTEFCIRSHSEVHTTRSNPFDYLSEPWAVSFPIDYPGSLSAQLAPYLRLPSGSPQTDAAVVQLAQSLAQKASDNVGYFLMGLTQHIPQLCDYQQRLEGAAYSPGITLQKKLGTCRDFAVLFVAACRAMGLAARFVSGYQEGDAGSNDSQTTHDLHAWAEVYVPGGGWRGFDPTLGLAVADRHVAIAASYLPPQAAPVTGTIKQHLPEQGKNLTPVTTKFETDISLEVLGE